MRQDYYFTDSVPRINAKRVSRCRSKKAMLTGCAVTSFLVGVWQGGLLFIGVLGFANYVQKKW